MPQRNLLILLVAAAVSYACYVAAEQNPYARYLGRSLSTIEDDALERVGDEELFSSAIRAMVDVLHRHGDQHSQYIPREAADPLRDEMRQEFGGIGVRIRFVGDPPELVIVGSPEPGTPAARAEIRSADHVLEIDGRPTAGMSMNDVLQAMRGEVGVPVRLLLRHADDDRAELKELTREVIHVDSILGDRRTAEGHWEFRLEEDPRIAHIRLTSFGNRTAAELETVLDRITTEGVRGAVLDLRNDAGGSLDAAVAICRLLLPEGLTIVEIRGRAGVVQRRYTTTRDGKFLDLPLVVLVNQESASASEIVAACLQDHGRAAVAGQRTYGKGTVQNLIPIESGRSYLKLTVANYWRPSGKNIHRTPAATDADDWGVVPDAGLDVPLTDEEFESFIEYRNARDLWGDPVVEEAKPRAGDEPKDSGKSSPYIDRQLKAAVESLQAQLDSVGAAQHHARPGRKLDAARLFSQRTL